MTRLLTTEIATMTEMRDPQKVLDRARGRPVAVLKNSKLVGYFVPAEAVAKDGEHRVATVEEVLRTCGKAASVQPAGARLPEGQMSFRAPVHRARGD
jgi:antitoxin StbD